MRTGAVLACLCCLGSLLVTSQPQYRQRLGQQRGQRGRGQGRRRRPPVVVEYDDGTDYGGSETYSFEDERYGGGGRRREGQATYERTTQRSFGPYSCMKHEVKTPLIFSS